MTTEVAPGPQTEGETKVFDTNAATQTPLAYSQEDAETVDYHAPERIPWRPVWMRAAGVLAAAAAAAAIIITVWLAPAPTTASNPADFPVPVTTYEVPPPESPTPTAAPTTTVTVTQIPQPPVRTEVPPPTRAPSWSSPEEQNAEYFRRLTAAGIRLTDYAGVVEGAHAVCTYVAEGHTTSDVVNVALANNRSFTPRDATAYINASIQVYCPHAGM